VQSEGVDLAVREWGDPGDPGRPTIVLIHGYPDTSTIWDGVAERLEPRYHVVNYDLRGTGKSSTPRGPKAYTFEHLVGDLVAVIDAVAPDKPVHLVGHDWGSIQGWEAVTTARLDGRIASFTSISGPSLDHAGRWLRRNAASGRLGRVLNQMGRSWYIGAFEIPGFSRLAAYALARRGVDPRTVVNGAGMYRQNMRARLMAPRDVHTDVPVQLVVLKKDAFVALSLLDGLDEIAPAMWRRELRAGHWAPRTHAEPISRFVTEFVEHIEGAPASRALERARTGTARKPFEKQLVVITGGGSGIGRATALAFAERGAEVVIADIDLTAAERSAEFARLVGGRGYAFEVDVSDASAMERFAKTVESELGVPDVVVNNAGVGIAGSFLEHSLEDWQRIIDINLWGVIHGSRLFAKQMAERGEGGHIVNVASAAAFFPSRALPAYSTSKAAVLMLSECMRAELAHEGIGVSAICPGLINTSITYSSRFVGVPKDEQERRRRAAIRLYQIRNFTPDRVATEIVCAVRNNIAVVPVAPEAKALRLISRLSPRVMRLLARTDIAPR
jgi:NAD(P)-dependent dehydrogenase (short-subunit alcohol dehydrogenase family)/pimeloyl-ACP methyl ester carboxylesterase